MYKNTFKKILNEYTHQKLLDARKDWYSVINSVNKELYIEAIKMYDSFIDQFYSYKTTSYIRHGETKPGTGTGINLYAGNGIKKTQGKKPKLIIEYDYSGLSEGYEYDSAKTVFDYVINGVRFPYFDASPRWYGTYNGKYFNYTGTPKNAFHLFCNNFDNIARQAFYPKWRKMGWN